MKLRQIMSLRLCLSFGAALTFASVLVAHRDGPVKGAEDQGIVYVYFPSMCAAPGDARDCREIPVAARPGFASQDACFAHADVELERAADPRVLASCLREREI